jgi:3-oxoacyl-[acyl-carrier protein] reductase
LAAGFAALRAASAGPPATRALIHADLLYHNVLVRGTQVTAVLDWGCAMYGDPLCDVARLLYWWPWYPAWSAIATRSLFPADAEARLRARQLRSGLAHIAWSAFAQRPDDLDRDARQVLALARTWPAEMQGSPQPPANRWRRVMAMDLGLQGKAAAVAAANQGLGYAVAHVLAEEGCRVCICGRRPDAVQRAVAALRADTGGTIHGIATDLATPDGPQRFIDATVQAFGGVDVLVCNAGGPTPGTFDELDDARWQAAFELTVMSTVRLIRAALPSMRSRGGGRIAAITSTSVRQPIPGLLLSNALRAAVTGLLKTLSSELAPDGILVNAVAPGRFNTERVREIDSDRARRGGGTPEAVAADYQRAIDLARYGEPAEFARAVAFLVSWANTYQTGTVASIDGGIVRSV